MARDHFEFHREQLVSPKRPRKVNPPRQPVDAVLHGQHLLKSLASTREKAEQQKGFDERLLFKIEIDDFEGSNLESIPGVELISQEDKGVYLIFSSEEALEVFEARLTSLANGETPIRKSMLEALQSFDTFSPEDRTGWALNYHGVPDSDTFNIDVELWPLSGVDESQQMVNAFLGWLKEHEISVLDQVVNNLIIIFRLEIQADKLDLLLNHRDIRLVDLPPKCQFDLSLLHTDIQDLPEMQEPDDNAPGIVVLDSGLATGHPLLSSAVGDAQSFISGKDEDDEHGHGTMVAGKALYGDVAEKIASGNLIPELRLFSGRILDENCESNTQLIEHQIEKAVNYFVDEYKCKIFNLSYGDLNKPYLGGRIRGLSVMLDKLSRDLGVLFIVPTGNFYSNDTALNWKKSYPDSILNQPIVDPAPSVNSLTVGSIARYDQTMSSARYPLDPAEQTFASINQPSPFTRSGPSVKGAIKPELISYGGNYAVDTRTNSIIENLLGELSFSKDFAAGRLVAEEVGTSYASPYIANLAARILTVYPNMTSNHIRALLVNHASVPPEILSLYGDKKKENRVAGYGIVDEDALFKSLDDDATIIANTSIKNKSHHFYEIPVPEQFWSGRKRLRQVAVSLAYTPQVITTRLDYRTTRLSFKLIKALSLAEVQDYFNKDISIDETHKHQEFGGTKIVNESDRKNGTVQSSTWNFKQVNAREKLKKLFIVITRHDFPWAEDKLPEEESYSLIVNLRDKENIEAQLLQQVDVILQEKIRVRV